MSNYAGGRFSEEAREGHKHYRKWVNNPQGQSWKAYKEANFEEIASAIQKKKKYINDNSTSNRKQTRADREFLEESFIKNKPSLAKKIASRTRTEYEEELDIEDARASKHSRQRKQKIISDDLHKSYPIIKEKQDIIIDKEHFIKHYRNKKQTKLNRKYGIYKNGKPKKRAYLTIDEKGFLMDCYKKMIPPKLNYDDLYLPGYIETGTTKEGIKGTLKRKPKDDDETKGTSRKNYTKVKTYKSNIQEQKEQKEEQEEEEDPIYDEEYKNYSEHNYTEKQVKLRLGLLKQRAKEADRAFELAKRAGNNEKAQHKKTLRDIKLKQIKAIEDVLENEF